MLEGLVLRVCYVTMTHFIFLFLMTVLFHNLRHGLCIKAHLRLPRRSTSEVSVLLYYCIIILIVCIVAYLIKSFTMSVNV